MQRLTHELKQETDSSHLNVQSALRNFGIHHHNRRLRRATKTHSHAKKAANTLRTRAYSKMWLGHGLLKSWMPTHNFLGWSTTCSQTVTQPVAQLTKPCPSKHHRVNIFSNHSNQHFFLHQSLSWHITAFPASGFAAHLGTAPFPHSHSVLPSTLGGCWSTQLFHLILVFLCPHVSWVFLFPLHRRRMSEFPPCAPRQA